MTRLGEVFSDSPLLWYDEGKWRRSLRAWRLIATSHTRLAWEDLNERIGQLGFRRWSHSYRIRDVRNASVRRLVCAEVTVVLRNPEDGDDAVKTKEIVRAIVHEVSHLWMNTGAAAIGRKRGWVGQPRYIWVWLYRVDGPLRWLRAGGYSNPNLIVVGEKVYGLHRQPILLKNPDEVWASIRLRYRAINRPSPASPEEVVAKA